jgi:UDP-N-acetyl-2-amino-2-deoxyglucuronate dehydrogenase
LAVNFALIGAAGYIAPRHLRAIRDVGGELLAASDPHDSVGQLDSFGFEVRYFPEIERFDRFLYKRHRGPEEGRVRYVSVCTPNYLHDAHIRMALRNGADAICEKPLVINPWNLDALEELESETGRRVFTVLQLRVHPALLELKRTLDAEAASGGSAARARHKVELTYVTGRGPWYDVSWKGSEQRSGGVAVNIGIHFFDLLLWLFGQCRDQEVHLAEPRRMAGRLELGRADVVWFLSVNHEDLPFTAAPGKRSTYRSLVMDGREVEFSEGFTDLHTLVYEKTLAGEGFTIADARASIELVHRIRGSALRPSLESGRAHPFMRPRK